MDNTLNIENTEILNKYGLELDFKGEVESEKLSQIYEEISNR